MWFLTNFARILNRIGKIRGERVTSACDLAESRERSTLKRKWSGPARVARAPLITPTGCLPRRKSQLYVCKCYVYAMRVGTLMPGNRGCRSHASRWGPVLPDPGIRARPYPSFSFSRLPRFSPSFWSLLHLHTFISHILSFFNLFLSLTLSSLSFSLSSFADLGHYIYGRWRSTP